MSRIAIASMFRNATEYIDRYTTQMAHLTGWLTGKGHSIHIVGAVGYSGDNTWDVVNERVDFLMSIIKGKQPTSCSTLFHIDGGPVFEVAEHDDRWRHISRVCNQLLDQITPQDDYLIYIESDLIWKTDVIMHLLEDLDEPGVDAVAPLVIHKRTGLCYSIWGHRKNGLRFAQHPPYHPGLHPGLNTIDSADSCIVMKGEVARTARYTPPELAMVGFGYDINAKGYGLYFDQDAVIYHP